MLEIDLARFSSINHKPLTELNHLSYMKTKFLSPILMLSAASILWVGCERDERLSQGSNEEEEQVVESAAESEDASDDALEIVAQTETHLANTADRAVTTCATVSKDADRKQVTIDFGDGCQGPYGRERKGKIIVTYSGAVGDSLANRVITFDNYYVNNRSITGTIELRDVAINEDGNLQSTKKLVDVKVSFPNGEYVILNGSRTRELISGYADNDPANNVYRITGTLSGQTTTGRTFTQEITTPVISNWACAANGSFARVSGVVELTTLGGYAARKRLVDYGDGQCDNVVTITTYRRTFTVTVAD